MKRVWVFVFAWVFAGLSSGRAEAQVEAHDLRVFLDANVVRWIKSEETFKDFGLTSKERFEVTGSGAFVGAGVGAGFAISKYLIPTLYFSLQNASSSGQGFDGTVRQWELKPSLEFAVLPSLRFVPYVDAGLTLQRVLLKQQTDGGFESKTFGVGPAVSAGIHLFAIEHGSLDVSFGYRAVFFGKPKGEGEINPPDENKQHIITLNLGASLWI